MIRNARAKARLVASVGRLNARDVYLALEKVEREFLDTPRPAFLDCLPGEWEQAQRTRAMFVQLRMLSAFSFAEAHGVTRNGLARFVEIG
jgi:hypothetical protein